jgi:hypothetical protein
MIKRFLKADGMIANSVEIRAYWAGQTTFRQPCAIQKLMRRPLDPFSTAAPALSSSHKIPKASSSVIRLIEMDIRRGSPKATLQKSCMVDMVHAARMSSYQIVESGIACMVGAGPVRHWHTYYKNVTPQFSLPFSCALVKALF